MHSSSLDEGYRPRHLAVTGPFPIVTPDRRPQVDDREAVTRVIPVVRHDPSATVTVLPLPARVPQRARWWQVWFSDLGRALHALRGRP